MLIAPLLILAAMLAVLLAVSWRRRQSQRPILLLAGLLAGLMLFGSAILYVAARARG